MSALPYTLISALRRLLHHPGFLAASVITLGLGIGATTTLFGLVRGILLAPLPFPEPDQLVVVRSADPARGVGDIPLSLPDLQDWSERGEAAVAIGAYSTLPAHLVLQTESAARELRTTHVSAGFFPALGVAPVLGRHIIETDETGDPRVVVVSHGFWTGQLGGDPAAIGRTLRLSDGLFRVVGVMPPGFSFPEPGMEVWTPLAVVPESSIPMWNRGVRFLDAIARIAPGITPDRLQAELSSIAAALAEEYPNSNANVRGVELTTLRQSTIGGVRGALLFLFGAVGLVLAAACVNVANLVLTRSMARSKEFAVRLSLGAGRRHLLRMLVAESIWIGLMGGALGSVIAYWATRGIRLWNAGVLPRVEELQVGPVVIAFAIAVSLTAVAVSGLIPALRSSRLDPAGELRSRGATSSRSAVRVRRVLVGAQFAAAVVVLVGAGLLGRSLWALRAVDVGFEPRGAFAASLVIPASRYPSSTEYLGFHREALQGFRALPGVQAVGSIRHLPTRGAGESERWSIPGEASEGLEGRPDADLIQITPGLLRALGIPLIAGRDFADSDRADAPMAAIVSETFAALAFPGMDPLGRAITTGSTPMTIVGVAGDVLQRGPDAPAAPTIYVSNEQLPRRAMTFILRTAGDPLALTAPVLATIREIDPGQAVTEIRTLDSTLDSSVARPRFFALFLGALALMIVSLTAVGLYGVLAFLVRRRRPELGIRMAIGADRGDVIRLVLGEGARPVAGGLAVGLLIAFAGAGLARGLLFGIAPLDPWTFIGAVVALVLVAGVAVWVPARRAADLDPLIALRSE